MEEKIHLRQFALPTVKVWRTISFGIYYQIDWLKGSKRRF